MARSFKFRIEPTINQNNEPYSHIKNALRAIRGEQTGTLQGYDQMQGKYRVIDDGNGEHICTAETSNTHVRDTSQQKKVPANQRKIIVHYHPKPTDDPAIKKELDNLRFAVEELNSEIPTLEVWA